MSITVRFQSSAAGRVNINQLQAFLLTTFREQDY